MVNETVCLCTELEWEPQLAFSLFLLGQYIYIFSEVTEFAHCVVKTYVTQSSFEPNCLFHIKKDVN